MNHTIKKKKELLSLSDKHKRFSFTVPNVVQKSFFGTIMADGYSVKFTTFVILSASISLIASIFYFWVFKNILLALGIIIPSFFIYYFFISGNNLISNRLNLLNNQRYFVEILESELTATNATLEAIKNLTKYKLPKSLKEMVEEMTKRVQLGDSLEEVISDVEKQCDSNELKMAFSIIRINHNVGSSETINGLKEIAKNLEEKSDSVLKFKEKMSGQIVEKMIFFMISLFAPAMMELYRPGYFGKILTFSWGPWFLIFIFFIALLGQFIIENVIQKTLGEL